jgi:hypothetical protein
VRLAEVNVRVHATVPGSAVLISATAVANGACGSCDNLARPPSKARDRRNTSAETARMLGWSLWPEFGWIPGAELVCALQGPNCLPEDAVRCELVSASNSLLTGKLTGNFAESGNPP